MIVTEQNLAAVNTWINTEPRESGMYEIEAEWHWTCTHGFHPITDSSRENLLCAFLILGCEEHTMKRQQ